MKRARPDKLQDKDDYLNVAACMVRVSCGCLLTNRQCVEMFDPDPKRGQFYPDHPKLSSATLQ